MPNIQVKNVYKIFGPQAAQRAMPLLEQGYSKEEILAQTGCTVGVVDASFEVGENEIFVIMGLSGSGKSTLLRCLNRLVEPTAGQVLVDEVDVTAMPMKDLRLLRRERISMVFQHFGLLPHRSVLSNVGFGLELQGMELEERQESAMQAIQMVGLKGYESSMIGELSGGMQQRVGLARALATNPEILFMDEAFSALDPLIRDQMQDELLQLQSKMHKSIVFITHDLDEALKLGDRIAIMKDGEIVQIGDPEEILMKPADDYVRAFVENVDRTRVITAGTVMEGTASVEIPKDGPHVAVREMEKKGISTIYVTDNDRHFKGIVHIDDAVELAKKDEKDLSPIVREVSTTQIDTPLMQVLPDATETHLPVPVLDEEGKFRGIVTHATLLSGISKEDVAPAEPTQYQK